MEVRSNSSDAKSKTKQISTLVSDISLIDDLKHHFEGLEDDGEPDIHSRNEINTLAEVTIGVYSFIGACYACAVMTYYINVCCFLSESYVSPVVESIQKLDRNSSPINSHNELEYNVFPNPCWDFCNGNYRPRLTALDTDKDGNTVLRKLPVLDGKKYRKLQRVPNANYYQCYSYLESYWLLKYLCLKNFCKINNKYHIKGVREPWDEAIFGTIRHFLVTIMNVGYLALIVGGLLPSIHWLRYSQVNQWTHSHEHNIDKADYNSWWDKIFGTLLFGLAIILILIILRIRHMYRTTCFLEWAPQCKFKIQQEEKCLGLKGETWGKWLPCLCTSDTSWTNVMNFEDREMTSFDCTNFCFYPCYGKQPYTSKLHISNGGNDGDNILWDDDAAGLYPKYYPGMSGFRHRNRPARLLPKDQGTEIGLH